MGVKTKSKLFDLYQDTNAFRVELKINILLALFVRSTSDATTKGNFEICVELG